MEYRKLISFGKNSFVISIPKTWVVQNKLVKGDVVCVTEADTNLVLSKKEMDKDEIEKEITIIVDKKSVVYIAREVVSAYILNHRKIVLKGNELKTKIRDLQNIIQNMIALEIMEQTSDSMVAKDFLNMDKVSITELIRKMDVVTRIMLKDLTTIFQEDNYENMNDRDRDVNRLYFLLYRSVLYNLDNPSKAIKNFHLKAIDLLRMKFAGFHIEAIADEVRRTARFARALKLTAEKRKEVENIFNKLNNLYLETLKAYYNQDTTLALKLSDEKQSIDLDIEKLEKDIMKVDGLAKVTTRLNRMVSSIHNLGRVVYTLP